MDGPGQITNFQLEGGRDHNFAGRGNVGELRLHFRTLVGQLQRVNPLPRFFVFGADHIDQPIDHTLLGGREVTPFNTGLELTNAAEQGVDHAKHQRRLAHHQAAAAQWSNGHDVEVGGHCQFAQKRAVAVYLHRAHRNLGAAANKVKQADAKVAGKALVDDFHRRHPATHNALLAGNVVVADGTDFDMLLHRLLALARHPLQQGIDFFL